MIKYKNTKIINLFDFDKLVQETYNRPYSFQQQDGCKDRGIYQFEVPNKWVFEDFENDSLPEVVNGDEMGVSFKAWLERDPKQKLSNPEDQQSWSIDLWWERNFYPNVDMIIDDLYKKGLIESGEYSIKIDW